MPRWQPYAKMATIWEAAADSQLEWIKKTLSDAKDADYIIVAG